MITTCPILPAARAAARRARRRRSAGPGPLLAAAFLALAPGRSAAQIPAPAPQGTAPTNTAPSDPAALGFLRGTVDRRIANLVDAGVVGFHGRAGVSFAGQPAELFFDLSLDIPNRTVNLAPPKNPAPELLPAIQGLTFKVADIFQVSLPRSDADREYLLELEYDGDEVIVVYRPRVEIAGVPPMRIWYSTDGIPRRMEMQGPEGKPTVTEFKFEEVDGKSYLVEARVSQMQLVSRYQYAVQRGVRYLERILSELQGQTVQIQYDLELELSSAQER
jgi:hypothetical protein